MRHAAYEGNGRLIIGGIQADASRLAARDAAEGRLNMVGISICVLQRLLAFIGSYGATSMKLESS